MFSNLSESFLQSFGKKFSLTDKEELFDVIMEFENLVNFEFYVKFHQIKGIRDAGSTADFRILFEVLKFKNLEI